MAGKNLDYWYDEQIKRYLIQLVRVFSNFKVKENTSNGVHYNRVPARYGDISRMVAHILRNNSENAINSAPQITLSIQSIQPARDRIQEPYFVDTKQVAEREWNKEENVYTSEQGNLYTTKRYMPVPYNMSLQVDVWTTNTDTKLQILEQIFVIFNPSIQLQSNDNPLDWSSVFEVEMTDINWSSRTLPQGVDENLDIATLTFAVPIWISPPAKVQRQKIIQQILTDIHNTNSVADLGFDSAYYDFFGQLDADSTIIVAPNDYRVRLQGGTATLVDPQGNVAEWGDIINQLGEISETSRLELNTTDDHEDRTKMVIGGVTANPLSGASLIFNLDNDTLPSNTLTPLTKIINPHSNRPGIGLPPQDSTQRYLITEDITPSYTEWGITASANDIIAFDGVKWYVDFDSDNQTDQEWVVNSFTNKQYTWKDSAWISSHEGTYNPGYWRLIL